MDPAHESLVTAASTGDDVAIDALLERHLPALRAFVRLRMGKLIRARESQADIVQSVCREVLEGIDRFDYRGEAAFRSWLCRTALHKLVERNRYYRRERRDALREEPLGTESRAADDQRLFEAYRSVFTPSRDAAAREEIARLEQAFDELPEHYREVILLTRVIGLSHREAAAEMERSETSIRGLMTRALVRLAAVLRRGSPAD